MFSFLKRTHIGKPVLIVDIDSGSVAVAVAQFTKDARAHILFTERSFLPIQGRLPEQHTKAITGLLSEVAGRSIKRYSESDIGKVAGPVTSLHVLIGSPWVRSHTAVAQEVYATEKVVSDAVIKRIAKQALLDSSVLDTSHVFESSVTRVQLNGYSTAQPIGKHAHHIAVTTLQSDIDASLKQGVENALHILFPGREMDIRSSIRAALMVLHERARSHHYMLISMGSTSTDFIAVHKEDANEHVTLPLGTASIAKRLAGDNGLPEEIFSLMRMMITDVCGPTACDSLIANLATLEPELVKSFGDMFATIATRRKIPNTCFLLAHADFMPWLEHFLTRIDFAQFSVTAQPLTVEPLTTQHLRDHVAWNTGVKEDTQLGVAAIFVNNLRST